VIADAGVDQDVVMRRLDDETLDGEHQLVGRIEEFRLQPGAVLVEQLLGQGWKESHGLEECPFLLDDGVNGDVVERDRHRRASLAVADVNGPTCPRKRYRHSRHLYRRPACPIMGGAS
jgi:hypothetical protein